MVIVFAFVATVLNCTAAISSRGTVHYMNVAVRGKKTNIITKKLNVRYSVDENSVLGTYSAGTSYACTKLKYSSAISVSIAVEVRGPQSAFEPKLFQ